MTLVISDVHSNIIALEAVWKREAAADLIVCAGDLVDYGIYPCECIDWMIDKGVRAVSGNHDLAVLQAYDHPQPDRPLSWRDDNARKLALRHVDYLRALPKQLCLDIDGTIFGVTHDYRGYDIIRSVEAFRQFGHERFGQPLRQMIFGHTHRRELHYLSDQDAWLNPGSVSYRRDDELVRGAHYAVIQDGHVSLRTVAYPTEHLHKEVLAAAVCPEEKRPTYRWWSPAAAS